MAFWNPAMPRLSVALVLCLAAAPAWANLGVPIKEGESPNCPATRGVFVRKQDGARFAPDRYGAFYKDVLIPAEDEPRKRIEFTRGRDVLSGLLNGRRAYLFWANGEPRGTGITTSSWRNPVDTTWKVDRTKVPALKTLGDPWGEVTGPLSGTWVLTECRAPRVQRREIISADHRGSSRVESHESSGFGDTEGRHGQEHPCGFSCG